MHGGLFSKDIYTACGEMEIDMKYKLAVFDMDGTILNTLDDLHDSLNHTLDATGYPTHTLDEVRSFVGNGIRKLIERALPEDSSEEVIQNVHGVFSGYYKDHCLDKTRPYDGIIPLIASLRDAGCLCAVVSNKDDYAVQMLCEKFFNGLFDYSVGNKPGMRPKPAPDLVNEVLASLDVSRGDAVYIGDSEVDIATAKNAGMPCITVLWGFRDYNCLCENGAEQFAQTPDDVLNLIMNS